MAFDGLVLAAVRKELEDKIINAKIKKIYQPEKETVIFYLYNAGEKRRLLISANAQNARVHLTRGTQENPQTAPVFCMVLRKHLEGGRIVRVGQEGLERVLKVCIEAPDDAGIPAEKVLMVEIMGKHSNIILIDPRTGLILDGIKRYSYAMSHHREVIPGRKYIEPPTQEKSNPLDITGEVFNKFLLDSPLDLKVEKVLLNNINGFSPQTCREILARAGLPQTLAVDDCGEYELNRLWQAFSDVKNQIEKDEFYPTLVLDETGNPYAFSAIDLTQFGAMDKIHGEISEILDEYYSRKESKQQFTQKKANLLSLIRQEIEKNEKKLMKQEETLAKAEDAENYRFFGELITANIHNLSKGMTQAKVRNYYDPKGKTIEIPLDPMLTPSENAQYYFKKYNKSRKAVRIVSSQLEETKMDLDYLYSVAVSLEQVETEKDLEEIRQELVDVGYIKEKTNIKKKQIKEETTLKPMVFRSSDNFEILVGRNNKQNDYLTMKLARPEDLWFHTKDIPGAHVIVRVGQARKVPDKTLEEAASLAAYFSKARESAKVPVDYTTRNNVRKPRGSKPGMVIYDNQKTILVEPKLF